MRVGIVVCLLLGVGMSANAEDPPPSPAPSPVPAGPQGGGAPSIADPAAEAVLAAVKAKDDAAVKALAAKDAPDPWLVVDNLIGRGEVDAAEAFAKAAVRVDTEKLPAYVASRRGKVDDPARRARVAALNAALPAGRPAEGLAALGDPESGTVEDVVGVRLWGGRGLALAGLGRWAEAVTAFRTAADAAERLGWLARTAALLEQGGRTAVQGQAVEAAVASSTRLVALSERRADPRGVAAGLGLLGAAQRQQGDAKAARATLERALASWEKLGDQEGAALTYLELGTLHQELGENPEAAEALQRAATGFEAAGNRASMADALMSLGGTLIALGDLPKALASCERAREIFEALGSDEGLAGVLINLGALYRRGPLEDDAKAQASLERGLALAVAVKRKDFEGNAQGLLGEFYALHDDGVRALAAFDRKIALLEEQGDKAALAATLIDAGILLSSRRVGDPAKTLAYLERGLPLAEAVGQPRWAANALMGIGHIQEARERPAEALPVYERALAMYRSLGDARGETGALMGSGAALGALGEPAKALECGQRALEIQEGLASRDGVANVLELLGKLHGAARRYPEAVAAFGRAAEAWDALGDKAKTAAMLRTLADTHVEFGDLQKALATYQRALTLDEAIHDRLGASKSLMGIGVVHTYLSSYAQALDADERVRALQEALGDEVGAAMTLCNIGVVYAGLGDQKKALEMYERALTAQEALGDRTSVATTIGNIAGAHLQMGDAPKALEGFQRALAAWEALKDPVGVARSRLRIGAACLAAGEAKQAVEASEKGLAELEALGDKRGVASAHLMLAAALEKNGAGAKAIQAYERGARAAEKLGIHELLVEALQGLAGARLRAGDAGRALSDAHRAVTELKSVVGGLGEEEGSTARGGYTALFSTGLLAAAKADDAPEASFFLESGRAGSLLESLGARDQLRWAALPEELRRAEAEARAEEARALVASTKAVEAGQLEAIRLRDAELRAARSKVEDVGQRIQRDAKREAQLFYPVATPMEEIQALLAPGEALVLYGLASEAAADAHALVLTRADARIVGLGTSGEVVSACEALDASDAGVDPAAALARLRGLLVEPLGLSKEVKRLLVSPDGALAYVPFSALAPERDVAFVASGTTYGVLLQEGAKHGKRVLALADPDYTATFDPTALALYAPKAVAVAAAGPTRGGALLPLPGTRAEAMAIADVRLFAKEASEAGLRQALASNPDRWHAVHFACHGLVNPDRPTLSSLALTPDAGHDGFLTALEVLRMQIPADLVVLSACETARGKIAGGEGIVGLTRAFMFAGAPRVLCSLWKVDDDATRALMTKFYEAWNPKTGSKPMGTAEALRTAQAYVRSQEKWKHPYYWAAWVLWGLPE